MIKPFLPVMVPPRLANDKVIRTPLELQAMMKQLLAIALGGSVGAIARFLVANGIYSWLGRGFPFGTLFVNVSGSFLMGFLSAMLMQRFTMVPEFRALILVGFLGAYTTFSTFAVESLYLFEEGNLLKAVLNIFLSLVLCLAAVWIGLVLGRRIFDNDAYRWLDQIAELESLFGMLIGFLSVTMMQIVCQRLNLALEWRLAIFVLLLGAFTVSSTLWIAGRLFGHPPEFQNIAGIFAAANLGGMLVIWLGVSFGNWLWQLNLSR